MDSPGRRPTSGSGRSCAPSTGRSRRSAAAPPPSSAFRPCGDCADLTTCPVGRTMIEAPQCDRRPAPIDRSSAEMRMLAGAAAAEAAGLVRSSRAMTLRSKHNASNAKHGLAMLWFSRDHRCMKPALSTINRRVTRPPHARPSRVETPDQAREPRAEARRFGGNRAPALFQQGQGGMRAPLWNFVVTVFGRRRCAGVGQSDERNRTPSPSCPSTRSISRNACRSRDTRSRRTRRSASRRPDRERDRRFRRASIMD